VKIFWSFKRCRTSELPSKRFLSFKLSSYVFIYFNVLKFDLEGYGYICTSWRMLPGGHNLLNVTENVVCPTQSACTGHTQKNGAVLIVNTIKTASFSCVCPV
jgi:hypothetical protein